jgi:hypothetical protein
VALGRNLDASAVLPSFLVIAQPPYIPPRPKPKPNRRAKLIARREVLRYVLAHYGCRQRVRMGEPLGPRCRRWFREGDRVNAELRAA